MTLMALPAHKPLAASIMAFLASVAFSLPGVMRALTLNLGGPPFMPAPGLNASSHVRRTPLRITDLEEEKFDILMVQFVG